MFPVTYMLYILYGEDDYSLQQYLNDLKKSVGDETVLAANTTELDGAQVTVNQIRAVCEVVPFMADKRLVIINGLMERFDPKPKTSKGKSGTPAKTEDHNPSTSLGASPFADYLPKIPGSTILVLVDRPPERDKKARDKNPLLSALSDKAKIVVFPALKDRELQSWIQKGVAGRGGNIAPGAIELLARTVGGNLWIMSNEIDKLIAYAHLPESAKDGGQAAGRQIVESDIERLVAEARETSIFSLVDAIVEFRANVAQEWLEKLLQKGASTSYVLTMLARQVNMVVRAKEMRRQGKSMQEIRTQLNITQEFVLNRVLEQSGRYTYERLKEVYHKLLETDIAIKTGKYEGELALNMLVAELCQRPRQYA
jgi:DNA polymerase-3 subunit delta